MSKPRVLIVDNDIEWQNEFYKTLDKDVFEVFIAQGKGDSLIEDAINKCKNHRCHVAIVDIRLRDDNDKYDFSGIDEFALTLEKNSKIPELLPTAMIFVSGKADLDTSNKQREKCESKGMRCEFITKLGSVDDLPRYLTKFASEKSSAYKGIQPIIEPSFGDQLDRFLERMEFADNLVQGREVLADLLVQLYPEATGFKLKAINEGPNTTSTTLVRNSFVCRVELDGLARIDPVVKFARPSAIRAEHQNYQDFVYHRIPWQSYAGLDESLVLFYKIGAIGLDMLTTAEPFSSKYHLAATSEKLNSVLDSIEDFSKNWTHYTSGKFPGVPFDGKDFLTTYITVWDKNKSVDADTFNKRITDTTPNERWNHDLPTALIPEPTLVNPIYWLKQRMLKATVYSNNKVPLGVTHGDAWGENLFVTSYGTAIWIDYERTGFGYLLQDFVRLEFDVLTRLIEQNDDQEGWRNLFYLYSAIIQNNELNVPIEALPKSRNIQKAVQVVNKIRAEASLHSLGTRDTQQYLMAMLFDAIFRSTLREPRSSEGMDENLQKKHEEDLKAWEYEKRRAMLLGALIVDRLSASHHAKPWPPPNWGPFFTREQLRTAVTRFPWQRDTVISLMFNVIGADYGDFDGDVLKTKMISLYKKCEEQGILDDLVKQIQILIPNFVRVLEEL